MMLYICTKAHENIEMRFRVIEGLNFQYLKTSNGHNSVKDVSRVIVLVLLLRPLTLPYAWLIGLYPVSDNSVR